MSVPSVLEWSESSSSARLVPTTVRELGKNEAFLEDLIAEHPGILKLES